MTDRQMLAAIGASRDQIVASLRDAFKELTEASKVGLCKRIDEWIEKTDPEKNPVDAFVYRLARLAFVEAVLRDAESKTGKEQ